jgi:hypothetical protein
MSFEMTLDFPKWFLQDTTSMNKCEHFLSKKTKQFPCDHRQQVDLAKPLTYCVDSGGNQLTARAWKPS